MNKIKHLNWMVLIVILSMTITQSSFAKTPFKKFKTRVSFVVDVTKATESDLFKVTVLPEKLGKKNNVYNLASTAPGTYDILDFGRFVKSFKAIDKSGNEIKVKQLSTNRWKIAQPQKLAKIEYMIEDSYDSGVKQYHIAPMCGTGIEKNYILMNTFGVMGYFEGLQSAPVRFKIDKPEKWTVGTALNQENDGYFYAETFDHMADSPVLIGDLTKATTKVSGIDVEIYCHSMNGVISAQDVMNISKEVLTAAGKFLTYAPVKRYAFLMSFMDREMMRRNKFNGWGALEHSYSSAYAIPENRQVLPSLKDMMAHEFFHIITPLNIHSEIIEKYNFATPTADEHLWLYEGVTEWAAGIMQLRDKQYTLQQYLNSISGKINDDERNYDPNFSLSRLSLESYQPSGSRQYGNIYQRGALNAAMLDIRLLELSGGKRGLREVIIDLSKRYGKQKAFNSKKFFDVLVKETYPEIRQFINDHIKGTKRLPFKEYYGKVGVKYTRSAPSKSKRPMFGITFSVNQKREIVITGFALSHKPFGLKAGDVVVKLLGEKATPESGSGIFAKTKEMKVGDSYEIVVKRDGKEIKLKGKLLQRMRYNILEPMTNLTPAQQKMQDVWKQNLPFK